jgi:hypothetical protein
MGISRVSGAGRRTMAVAGALALFATAGRAAAQADPDFDAVAWSAAGCAAAELVRHASPAGVDLAGDATFPAVYLAHDDRYAYFRLRLDGSPAGPGGFASYSWTALMQVPSGDPFQYQYQISLDGVGDRIELWANTVAEPIDFSPLFRDASEVRLFSLEHDATGGIAGNTAPLARTVPTADGSSFGGDPDHFLDFAMPVAVLVAQGVIPDASTRRVPGFRPVDQPQQLQQGDAELRLPASASLARTAVAAVIAGVTAARLHVHRRQIPDRRWRAGWWSSAALRMVAGRRDGRASDRL